MTTIQEQLQIAFRKRIYSNGGFSFYAEHTGNVPQNSFIAYLLDIIDVPYCNYIIEGIEKAERNLPYLSHYEFDILDDDFDIEINPPSISFSQGATMPMQDFKQLLQEWSDYQTNNL